MKDKEIDQVVIASNISNMIEASYMGSLETVRFFVEGKKIPVDSVGEFGKTALISASENGHEVVVKYLVYMGANVNATDDDGNTGLIMATAHKHADFVKFFLANENVDISIKNSSGLDAVETAKSRGFYELAKLIRSARAKKPEPIQAVAGETQVIKTEVKAEPKTEIKPEPKIEIKKEEPNDINKGKDVKRMFFENWLRTKGYQPKQVYVHIDYQDRANRNITPLMVACKDGNTEIFEMLLAKNASLLTKDQDGVNPLMFAIIGGHLDLVKRIMELRDLVELCDNRSYNSIFVSIEYVRAEILELLLNSRPDLVNVVSVNNTTPLMFAVKNQKPELIDILLKAKADVNIKNINGNTALYLAFKNNDLVTAEKLVKAGADINYINTTNETPIRNAVRNKNIDAIKFLLDLKVDINQTNSDGESLLMTKNIEPSVVKFLIQNGIDTKIKDNLGRNAYEHGVAFKNKALITLLKREESEIDSLQIAKDWAKKHHFKTLSTALESGKSPTSIKSKALGKAIVELCLSEDLEIINSLLKEGINFSVFDDKIIPLLEVADAGSKEVFDLLIDKVTSINAKGEFGWTPLMMASYRGNAYFVEKLIVKGADVSTIDDSGESALMKAVQKESNEPIVSLLIKNGADTELKNANGKTALDLALEREFDYYEKMLRK